MGGRLQIKILTMEDTMTPRVDQILDGASIDEAEILTPMPTAKSVTMSFYDALKKVVAGEKITRISWGNHDYCLLKDGYLSIFRNDGFHGWLVNDGDMEGMDWCII